MLHSLPSLHSFIGKVTLSSFYTYSLRFLTYDAPILVANAFVSSRMDYCNSLLRSLSKFSLCKLQCIQNSSARIVSNMRGYTSITPVLRKLHWFPLEHRSLFKTATLVYKLLHAGFPRYFTLYISSYSSAYSTPCSKSGGNFLDVPKFNPTQSVKQFGYSFAFDASTCLECS